MVAHNDNSAFLKKNDPKENFEAANPEGNSNEAALKNLSNKVVNGSNKAYCSQRGTVHSSNKEIWKPSNQMEGVSKENASSKDDSAAAATGSVSAAAATKGVSSEAALKNDFEKMLRLQMIPMKVYRVCRLVRKLIQTQVRVQGPGSKFLYPVSTEEGNEEPRR